MASPGSVTVGHVAPNSSRHCFAGSAWSLYRTPSTTRPSDAPSCSRRSLNSGNSSRHGTHHDAQKFTMTGWPRYAARSIDEPSSAVPAIAGAGCPVRASAPPPHAATSTASARTMESRTCRSVGRLLEGDRPRHVRVDRADEGIGAGGDRGHVVDDDLGAFDDLAHEQLTRRAVDRDVVRLPLVLVVYCFGECVGR